MNRRHVPPGPGRENRLYSAMPVLEFRGAGVVDVHRAARAARAGRGLSTAA
jgi:hypothetical protein